MEGSTVSRVYPGQDEVWGRGCTHHVLPWPEGQRSPIFPPRDDGLWVAPRRPTLQNHLLAFHGHCVPWLNLEILLEH